MASVVMVLGITMFVLTPAMRQETLTFSGEVPDDGVDHFFVPFEVPDGTVEIEIRHDDLSEANILDWGLLDGSGAFRGLGWWKYRACGCWDQRRLSKL